MSSNQNPNIRGKPVSGQKDYSQYPQRNYRDQSNYYGNEGSGYYNTNTTDQGQRGYYNNRSYSRSGYHRGQWYQRGQGNQTNQDTQQGQSTQQTQRKYRSPQDRTNYLLYTILLEVRELNKNIAKLMEVMEKGESEEVQGEEVKPQEIPTELEELPHQ